MRCSLIRYPPIFSSITRGTTFAVRNFLIDNKILTLIMISFTKKQCRRDRFETIGPRRTFVKIEACTIRLRGCRTGRLRKKYGVNKFCLICSHKSVHQPLRLDEACKSCHWESTCMHDSPRIYTHARARGRSWAFCRLTVCLWILSDDYALLNSVHAIMHRIVDQGWRLIPVNAE